MGMAEDRDVVDHVEIGTAFDVEEIFAPASLDLRRVCVIVLLRGRQMGHPAGQPFAAACLGGVNRGAKQRRR